jgi:hypothetical protein
MNMWSNWIMNWLDLIIPEMKLKSWNQDIEYYKYLQIIIEIDNNVQWINCEFELWSINKIIHPTNDEHIQ